MAPHSPLTPWTSVRPRRFPPARAPYDHPSRHLTVNSRGPAVHPNTTRLTRRPDPLPRHRAKSNAWLPTTSLQEAGPTSPNPTQAPSHTWPVSPLVRRPYRVTWNRPQPLNSSRQHRQCQDRQPLVLSVNVRAPADHAKAPTDRVSERRSTAPPPSTVGPLAPPPPHRHHRRYLPAPHS